MASFAHLKPLIMEILRAPDIDLASISAKRVRKALGEKQPDLDIKEHKAAIDAIIIEAFHEIAPPEPQDEASLAKVSSVNGDSTVAPPKRKRSATPVQAGPSSPAAKMSVVSKVVKEVKAKARAEAMTDEEMARQLHEQLNNPGRSTRAGTGYAPRARGGSSKTKKTKSSAYVDDSDIEDEDTEHVNGGSYRLPKKRVKRERDPNKPARGGFHKAYRLSDELAEVVGAKEMSRPQVIKLLWEYIRQHQLQDPNNRKTVLCDTKLQAVFARAKIDAFKLNKPLQKHFYALEAPKNDLVDSADEAEDDDEVGDAEDADNAEDRRAEDAEDVQSGSDA